MSTPEITVLVPARNEAHDIAGCIAAIAAQTVPRERMEVLLVDGQSADATIGVAQAAADAAGLDLTIVTNPDGATATSLNMGLERARGEVVVRVDARARLGHDHVRRCHDLLNDPRLGVVGGGQRAVPRCDASLVERGIARNLRNRYTTGLARYRRSVEAGSTDTVWMGAFRRSDLEAVGGWPTTPAVNEDYRLNQRLRGRGMIVWFDPELTADYLPRRTYRRLGRQYWRFGRTKGSLWRSSEGMSRRHVALVVLPVVATVGAVAGVRRWGLLRTGVAGVLMAAAVDEVGSQTPAPLSERACAIGAAIVANGSWWAAATVGLIRPMPVAR